MFIIYRPKPTNIRPRKTLSLDVDSYHRPSPNYETMGVQIDNATKASPHRKHTPRDDTRSYGIQVDAHVASYINYLLA